VWNGVERLGLVAGDEVLMPAYHHGSEVEAVSRRGVQCRFYEGDERLEPTEPELNALLGARTRALYLIHYQGFPQDAARWRRWCDERGLMLIEDAAQAWLATRDGTPVGSHGDLAFFCLYKSVGLPEGAALVMRSPPATASLDRRPGAVEIARLHAAWVAGRSKALAALMSPLRRGPSPYDPARDFDLRDPADMPWSTTCFLLRRLASPDIAERRRDNYRRLLARVGERVRPPFDQLPTGASPFVLPLEGDKPELMRRLRSREVVALDLWSTPHPSLPSERFPAAAGRRARTVGLSVHQELRPADIDRIAGAVGGGSQM